MYSIDSGFGWWRPCPRIDYQPLNDQDFNNHSRLIELRQNLRTGIKDPLCQKCWSDQERGIKSYRQVLKQDFRHPKSHLDKMQAPKIFEIKFQNLCNLKCVFCSSNCSSLWEREFPVEESRKGQHRGPKLSEELLNYLQTHYEEISVFQVFGGEPALHEEFYRIIDILLQAPDSSAKKTVSFSTNLYYPTAQKEKFESAIERLLQKGHKLYLRISIDGVGEQGEYLRTGLKWKKFADNLLSFRDRFSKFDNLGRVKCNIALNILNLVYLDRIMHFLDDQRLEWVEPHYNYVGKPERFMLQSYGSKLSHARQVIEAQDFRGYTTYKNHVLDLIGSMTHLEPDRSAIENCQSWLNQYDQQVNKDFLSLFPENNYLFT